MCYFLSCLSSNHRATASMYLEKQIKNVDSIVSGFEEQLVKDGVILDEQKALQNRNQQLQVSCFIMQPKQDRLT